jgi:hypothetical protein
VLNEEEKESARNNEKRTRNKKQHKLSKGKKGEI